MFCSKCGRSIPDDVNFCPSCGMQIVKNIESDLAVEKKQGYDLKKTAPQVSENTSTLDKCRYDEPMVMEPVVFNGKYTDDDRHSIKISIVMMLIGFAGMVICYGYNSEKSDIAGAYQENEKAAATYQMEKETTNASYPQYRQYNLEKSEKENDPYERVYHRAAEEVKRRLESPPLGDCNFKSEGYSEEYIVKKEMKRRDFGDGKGELLFEHIVCRVPATWDTLMNGRVSRGWFVNAYYYRSNKDGSNEKPAEDDDFVNILNVKRALYLDEEDIINNFE